MAVQKLEDILNKLQKKKFETPDVVRGSWSDKTKTIKDSNGQEWTGVVDLDSVEKTDDEITYMIVSYKKSESKIEESKLMENAQKELEVNGLTWSFPYWNHRRPEEGQAIIQKRDTKGGLAYDGLVMLDYKIYKINLWEKPEGGFNVDGKEERAERARLAELNKK